MLIKDKLKRRNKIHIKKISSHFSEVLARQNVLLKRAYECRIFSFKGLIVTLKRFIYLLKLFPWPMQLDLIFFISSVMHKYPDFCG